MLRGEGNPDHQIRATPYASKTGSALTMDMLLDFLGEPAQGQRGREAVADCFATSSRGPTRAEPTGMSNLC